MAVTGGATVSSRFGRSVPLSTDETFVAVGSPAWGVNGDSAEGQASVVCYNGTNWARHCQVVDGPAPNDHFGIGLDLSVDASTLAAGSLLGNDAVDGSGVIGGYIRVFQFNKEATTGVQFG